MSTFYIELSEIPWFKMISTLFHCKEGAPFYSILDRQKSVET